MESAPNACTPHAQLQPRNSQRPSPLSAGVVTAPAIRRTSSRRPTLDRPLELAAATVNETFRIQSASSDGRARVAPTCPSCHGVTPGPPSVSVCPPISGGGSKPQSLECRPVGGGWERGVVVAVAAAPVSQLTTARTPLRPSTGSGELVT